MSKNLYFVCLIIFNFMYCIKSQNDIQSETLDIEHPEVIKVAEFGAQQMSTGTIVYTVDKIVDAKRNTNGSDMDYEVSVVLAYTSPVGCLGTESGNCIRKINCKLNVRKLKSTDNGFKLESFGCTPMAVVRRRRPSKSP